jgi:fructokinase
MNKLVGAIEAGGTKFNCAILDAALHIVAEERIPTTTPAETFSRVISFFQRAPSRIESLGISTFGPIDLDRSSPTYGSITTTPKPGWRDTSIVAALQGLDVPIAIDTDVNGAAYGEFKFGAARGLHTFIYYTIGTGIGGGGMVGGKLMHGLTHPEMGHVFIPHDRERDPFSGCCPSHGDCFEGLASGPALRARWQQSPEELPPHHHAWALQVRYTSLALANTICMLSPQRIILGGGVMDNQFLFPLIRREVQELLHGYVHHRAILEEIDSFIVPPQLGSQAGIIGAAALALDATA